MKSNRKAWIILILLVAIYWIGGRLTYESPSFLAWIYTKSNRYITHFLMVVVVFVVGYLGLHSLKNTWPKQIWILLYIIVLSSLLLFGGIDYFLFPLNKPSFRNFITSLHVFFSTPVTYGVLFFLHRLQEKQKNNF